jgi:hypothetical protein
LGLEYVYAECNTSISSSINSFGENAAYVSAPLSPADLGLLANLPADWLKAVEDAALCGNDRAIAEQALKLPPQFASLAIHLTELAEQFQFEEIIQLLCPASS